MEQPPLSSPEQLPEPGKSGELSASKEKDPKRRKKTRVAKKVKKVAENLVQVEDTTSQPEELTTRSEKKVTKLKKAAPEAGYIAGTSEGPETQAAGDPNALSGDKTGESADESSENTVEDDLGLEAGDAEPVIFDRHKDAEAPEDAEAVSMAEAIFLPPVAPLEAPGGQKPAEKAGFPPLSEGTTGPTPEVTASVGPDAPAPGAETAAASPETAVATPVFYEDLAPAPPLPPMPERLRMLDPGAPDSDGGEVTRRGRTIEADTVDRREYNDAVYRAEQRGTRRGVLAGGLAGWWLGRRGKREALEQAGKQLEKSGKEINKLKKDQLLVEERLRQVEAAKQQLPLGEQITGRQPEQPAQAEQAPVPPLHFEVAALQGDKTPQKEQAADKLAGQETAARAETAPEDQPVTEETYQTPEGRRIETSAWHAIEIDEKTGKAVANPERAYGEEFKHEQQQEKLHHQAAVVDTASQLGQTILHGVPSSGPGAVSSVSSTGDEDKSAQKSTNKLRLDKDFVRQHFVRRTLDPRTWVLALVLVVLLFFFFGR